MSQTQSTGKPSARRVVLIMTDGTRNDFLNCYRQTGLRSPHLDGLASGGCRFDKAYTTQPVCGPARSALFTGLYPHANGMWGNSMFLGDKVKTIGQRLSDQGVHCAYIGKWHLDGTDYFGDGICPPGWDDTYWYDMRRYLDELPPEDRTRSRDDALCDDPNLKSEFTYGHRVSDRAVDFLSKHGDEDFFLTVSYDEPHGPCLAPKAYQDHYKDFEFPKDPNVYDTLDDKPEHQRVWSGDRRKTDREALRIKDPKLFGVCEYVDEQIGRVIEAINQHAPDALVIFTSDHGSAMESHCLNDKGPAMYDEIAKIPLIVRWPGQVQEGSTSDLPISHINLVPTIMEAMGKPIPKWMDGPSVLPTLLDPATSCQDEVFLEWGRYEIDHDGFTHFQPIRAVFDGRYKLVINLLTSDELYDLDSDPYEMTNLIESADHKVVRDQLHDRIIAWQSETRDPFRGSYWLTRPWRKDAPEPTCDFTGMTRQREHEEYEPRQLDYSTGLPMKEAVRKK